MAGKWFSSAMSQANAIGKKLENTIIEAESNWLVISMNWKMEIQEVKFEKKDIIWNEELLVKSIKECLEKWFSYIQKIVSEEYWKALNEFKSKK